ncbi:CLUMA_CG016801, isoform A [Clunio marinus]|uniref:CLUMA_CG016801, isoform A n=1 Tax=Clunio marinus TaxID=568069 RepID=A0A1J1ITG2_9DIPT|nr:CLUMA_CG016801, isoform A [Clunio marinus]
MNVPGNVRLKDLAKQFVERSNQKFVENLNNCRIFGHSLANQIVQSMLTLRTFCLHHKIKNSDQITKRVTNVSFKFYMKRKTLNDHSNRKM